MAASTGWESGGAFGRRPDDEGTFSLKSRLAAAIERRASRAERGDPFTGAAGDDSLRRDERLRAFAPTGSREALTRLARQACGIASGW
jgi:hypothetical protein